MPFTIEQFYVNIGQNKLLGVRCNKCGRIYLPPRTLCSDCYSRDFEWTELPTKGKLLTYTVIHVAPEKFQSMTPYAVGVIELENGLKIPGMIREVPTDQIKIGMKLAIDFGICDTAQTWPRWPRYFFKAI